MQSVKRVDVGMHNCLNVVFCFSLWPSSSKNTSVRPSISLSVCHTFFTMFLSSYHIKFSGVIAIDRSAVHAKGQGQRSKVKVTEVKTQFNRLRTVTPVCIYIWQWNDAQRLMWQRRGALLFFKVVRQISRSHGTKNCWIWPKFGISGL